MDNLARVKKSAGLVAGWKVPRENQDFIHAVCMHHSPFIHPPCPASMIYQVRVHPKRRVEIRIARMDR